MNRKNITLFNAGMTLLVMLLAACGSQSTETPIPSSSITVTRLSENCIHSQFWKADSTDVTTLGNVSTHTDGCYGMESLGIFTDSAGILHLNYRDQNTAIASGIYTSIKNNSVIEFKIYVHTMYTVYNDNPVTVSFAIATQGDPMTAKNTARFKLYVEDNLDKPIVYFMLADAGDNTGTKIGDRHYEYGRTYTIRLELLGNSMQVFIDNQKMNEGLLIPSGHKVFYIGYDVPILGGVDVEVSGLTVDGAPR